MPAQKGALSIAFLVIIILVVGGAALFFIKSSPKPQQTNPLVTQAQPQPTASQMGLKFDFPASKIDPFNDKNGPFYHQVFLSKSADGLNFEKGNLVFDKASVPDLVRLPTGRLLAYMVDGAARSKSGVMVALSDDDGVSWDQGSMQLKRKTSEHWITDPQVLLLRDGTLVLYYIVFSGSKNLVKSATSVDGINFEEEEGTRFEYPGITDPDIVVINDKWFMYLSQGPKLISTSSDDGLNFKLEKTIRNSGSALPAGRQVSKTVYVDVNFYRQFYCLEGNIKSAKTSNGLTFIDEPGFRLTAAPGKTICDPAPIHLGGSWLMLYKTKF